MGAAYLTNAQAHGGAKPPERVSAARLLVRIHVPANLYGGKAHRGRVQRVSGGYYDGRRFRRGTVGWEDGVIVETTSGLAREPLAKGLIIPPLWNAHTHLGDAVVTRELSGSIEELVAPPRGLKHRVLARARDQDVIRAMRRALVTALNAGTGGVIDFREGGIKGLKLVYRALLGLPTRAAVLGRPSGLTFNRREVSALLRACDGIGVSSYIDWPAGELRKLAAHAAQAGKSFATHCSERVREDIDAVLELKPTFLVHMIHATDSDLERCAEARVPVVICPRSNAFFGMTPDVPRLLRAGIEVWLGTDNAMISTPSLLREMEFAYRIARLRGGVPAMEILEMALRGRRFVDPKATTGIRVGNPADLVVFALPDGEHGFASLLRAVEADIALVVSGGIARRPPLPSEEPTGTKRLRPRRAQRTSR